MLDEVDFQAWNKKRTRTFYVYVAQALLNGLEFAVSQASAWNYVNTLIKPDDPKLYYGIINGIILLGPLLFGSILGKWIDRRKETRLSLIFLNFMLLVGTIFYMLPFSPALPAIGKFLYGARYIIRSIMYAELSKSYPSEELQEKIPIYLAGLCLGACIGPLCNMIYLKVDFWIGNLHFLYGNATSLTILILVVVQVILLVFFSYDVSKIYDLKFHQSNQGNSSASNGAQNKCGWIESFKNLFSFEFAILMIMSLHSGLGLNFFRVCLPLICQTLDLGNNAVNWSFIGTEISGVVILSTFSAMKLSCSEMNVIGQVSLISFMFTVFGIQLISIELPYWVNIYLLVASILAYGFFNATTQAFLVVTCNKMIAPEHQTFGESIRSNISITGRMVAGLSTAFIYQRFWIFTIVNTLWTAFMLISVRSSFNTTKAI